MSKHPDMSAEDGDEFSFPPEIEREHRAWAALKSHENGMGADGIQLLYGFTLEELKPYEAEWRAMRAGSGPPT